ncbi:MAG: septum formation initiator family protein [Acidobacteria bacterium]|nr:septum formation initiator family protein [Acidobacteriota bacterium]
MTSPRTTGSNDAPGRGTVTLWMLCGAAAALSVYALFNPEGILRQWERLRQRDHLAAELAREERINEELRRELAALTNDDLAIAQAIRGELDYQKPGEVVLFTGERDPLKVPPPSVPKPR